MKITKKICSMILCLVMVLSIMATTATVSVLAESYIYCSQCGKRISAESNFCMYCGQPVVYTAESDYPTWGSWSSWSTTRAYASDTRQVERRTVVAGYNMVHYGTQTDSSPHYRMFRNYSIQAHLGDYGARASYGEKHFTRYVTPAMLSYAVRYEPGELITGEYPGYQKGTTTAYSFGDDKYVWFIESTDERTEYRYRDLY